MNEPTLTVLGGVAFCSIAELQCRESYANLSPQEGRQGLMNADGLPPTMQIGMLKHLLPWLYEFLKQHKRLDKFNDIWLSSCSSLSLVKCTVAGDCYFELNFMLL